MMGRTNPTYRNWLERHEAGWEPFRRALRSTHREDFDRLFERANEHAAAAAQQNHADPELATVFAILLSQERELRELRERLRES